MISSGQKCSVGEHTVVSGPILHPLETALVPGGGRGGGAGAAWGAVADGGGADQTPGSSRRKEQ